MDKKGIDYSKGNLYNAIGRPELRPNKFKITEDEFHIKWDDREAECDFVVRIDHETEDKSKDKVKLLVDLCREREYIEGALDLRTELREDIKNNDIKKLLSLISEWHYEGLVEFLQRCEEYGFEMSEEKRIVSEKCLSAIKQHLGIAKEDREEYKEDSQSYLRDSERIRKKKSMIKYLTLKSAKGK